MHQDTRDLNELLLGQHMAIDSLRDYINSADDNLLRGQLEEALQTHERQAEELSDHIRSLGDSPKETRGMAGLMRTANTRMSLSANDSRSKIVASLIRGEEMGIDEEIEVLKKVSPKSQALVQKHIDENKLVLERMRGLNAH